MDSSRGFRFGAFVASILLFSLVGVPAGAQTTASVYAQDSITWHPEYVDIDPGGTITWENRDTDNPHTVECDQGSSNAPCAWSTALEMPQRSSQFAQPSRVSVTFPNPGIYSYYCSIHPKMQGTITVGSGHPNPTATSTPKPRTTTSARPTTRASTSVAPSVSASASARASKKPTPKTSVKGNTVIQPGPTLSGKALGETTGGKNGPGAGILVPAALLIALVGAAHVARARRRSA